MSVEADEIVAERACCAACGGAGGGPFGRPGSGWDIETYECPQCFGTGWVLAADEVERARAMQAARDAKPGVAKVPAPVAVPSKRAASDKT